VHQASDARALPCARPATPLICGDYHLLPTSQAVAILTSIPRNYFLNLSMLPIKLEVAVYANLTIMRRKSVCLSLTLID